MLRVLDKSVLRIKAGIAKKHVLLFFLHSARIGWLPISDIDHDN